VSTFTSPFEGCFFLCNQVPVTPAAYTTTTPISQCILPLLGGVFCSLRVYAHLSSPHPCNTGSLHYDNAHLSTLVLGSPVQSGFSSIFGKTGTETGPRFFKFSKTETGTDLNRSSAVFCGFLRSCNRSQPVSSQKGNKKYFKSVTLLPYF
jgi:hypothetical protein